MHAGAFQLSCEYALTRKFFRISLGGDRETLPERINPGKADPRTGDATAALENTSTPSKFALQPLPPQLRQQYWPCG
jgi:hypothetical protein